MTELYEQRNKQEIKTIRFLDRETGEEAELSEDGEEFVINADGKVAEFVDQSYANFSALIERENLTYEIQLK